VDYITKPIQPKEVLARVHTHLMVQQLQRTLQQRNEELAESLEREKELNQLKSRFVSMVSHEFKTPLTTISLSCNLLQRYGERMAAEDRGEELKVIERTVDYMRDLLDNVLTVSRWEAGKIEFRPTPTNVLHLCQHLMKRFQTMHDATHRLEFITNGEFLDAQVDPRLLEHILSNLLSNAFKYSPAGGTVWFTVTANVDSLVFQVKDEGIGISEADQQRLFESFHRGDNVGNIKGTGLGLSIVEQFIGLHGGDITVESVLNQGTNLTVTLPTQPRVQE
jgi:signal transduction histidine kinase